MLCRTRGDPKADFKKEKHFEWERMLKRREIVHNLSSAALLSLINEPEMKNISSAQLRFELRKRQESPVFNNKSEAAERLRAHLSLDPTNT